MDKNSGVNGSAEVTNFSKLPSAIESFRNDSSEIRPFCSNFRNVGRPTPDRSASPA